MIADLKPYADYKDSGLPWLGQVPRHWEVRRIKTALREVDRRSSEGLEPLLSLRMQAGLVDHHLSGGRPIPPSALIGYKRVLPGEIVMNRMRASLGLFAAATSDGLVSPDYAIFRPVDQVNVAYAVQLFRTPAMAAVFRLESTGLGSGESGFLRLYSDQFGRLAIPIPPCAEQAAIVRFLDRANSRLELAIRAKRKVISLLTEQQQVVIHRAVSRGLNQEIALKPSGIPWLGDIPQHWELRRLRQVAFMKPSKSESEDVLRRNGPVTFLPMERVGTGGTVDSSETVKAASVWNGFTYFSRGDVIVAKITPCFENGKGAFLENLPTAIGFGSTEFHVMRPSPRLLGAYLRLITSSKQFLQNGTNSMTGSAGQQRVPTDFVKNYLIALPPVAEQRAILELVNGDGARIDAVVSRLQREIDLLREYRSRLVADVVTGKLDVREAAARLPDEAWPEIAEESIDETDTAELIAEETEA